MTRARKPTASVARDHGALHAFVDGRMRTGFAWGDHDCVTFAAKAAQAQTGVDYLKGLGRWRTAEGAARALKVRGGLLKAVDSVLRRVPPAMAHRGDIGLVVIDGRKSLVIVEGDLVVGPGEAGLVRLPRAAVTAAWTLTA